MSTREQRAKEFRLKRATQEFVSEDEQAAAFADSEVRAAREECARALCIRCASGEKADRKSEFPVYYWRHMNESLHPELCPAAMIWELIHKDAQ